jgi:site-specific DNA-methyltransferase (adenine-specific)
MGSGTTAVAAMALNRKYLGFEINETYIKKANDRIKRKA